MTLFAPSCVERQGLSDIPRIPGRCEARVPLGVLGNGKPLSELDPENETVG
jgi:hypothetical protein